MTPSAGCYALGYLTGMAAFAWMARRRNLATAGIMAVMGAGLLCGLVGANLTQWVYAHLVPGGEPGKTVLGGIAGGYLSVLLVLLFQRCALLVLSGLAILFYVLASLKGVKEWRCWAKPPWVTLFWGAIFAWQVWALVTHHPLSPF